MKHIIFLLVNSLLYLILTGCKIKKDNQYVLIEKAVTIEQPIILSKAGEVSDSSRNILLQFPANDTFRDEVDARISAVKYILDSISKSLKHPLIQTAPVFFDTTTAYAALSYVIRNNLDTLRNFVDKSIELRIAQNGKNIHESIITKEMFYAYFNPDWEKKPESNFIYAIENVSLHKDRATLEIMLCVPDTDIDSYFEYSVSFEDNSISIKDVSSKYYSDLIWE
ncbi:MAG: hypothetical protein IJO23_01115 [Bacteroidales bacterium]|nr:hypothetical protein [Bacteroidales bacterium]